MFHGKTYQDLIDGQAPGPQRRPYVVLNAADMATGSVFSFNQDQFDLICADLARLKIADAVSASAAFPVALSALTLRNRAPCAAQSQAAAATDDGSGWQAGDGGPEPVRIANDRAVETRLGVDYPAAQNLARFRRGTVSLSYLNRDGRQQYIQLLGRLDSAIAAPFKQKSVVLVGFDVIADRGCRAHFQTMATSWTLSHADVADLIALGKAMVLQSPSFAAIVERLGGSVPAAHPTVEEICAPYKKA